MARIVFFITCLSLFCGIGGFPAAKAADSAYDVKGVQVDVLDASAVKARNKAFVEAQKKAFQVLATRYMTAEEVKTLTLPSDAALSGLIQDFEITSEQLSTKRYRGIYNFRFKAAGVNRYFGHGPSYFEAAPAEAVTKTLVIPYYQEGKNPVIFRKDQNLLWGSLLPDLPKDGHVILPEGNIQDRNDVGNKDPYGLSVSAIRRIKERYEVARVVAVVARVPTKGAHPVAIDVLEAGGGGMRTVASFMAEPQQVGPMTFQAMDTPAAVASEPVSAALADDAIISSDETPPPVATPKKPPVADVPTIPVARAVSGSVVGAGTAGTAKVTVFFTNIGEWMTVQKMLRQASGVTSLRITSLKTNQADTLLSYSDWSRVSGSLRSSGYQLVPQSGDAYILKH